MTDESAVYGIDSFEFLRCDAFKISVSSYHIFIIYSAKIICLPSLLMMEFQSKHTELMVSKI